MNLKRFMTVLLSLTVFGTVLGAAAFGLLGFAMPQRAKQLQAESAANGGMADPSEGTEPGQIQKSTTRHPVVYWAAVGGFCGALLGAAVGLIVAILDGVLLALRRARSEDVAEPRSETRVEDYAEPGGRS